MAKLEPKVSVDLTRGPPGGGSSWVWPVALGLVAAAGLVWFLFLRPQRSHIPDAFTPLVEGEEVLVNLEELSLALRAGDAACRTVPDTPTPSACLQMKGGDGAIVEVVFSLDAERGAQGAKRLSEARQARLLDPTSPGVLFERFRWLDADQSLPVYELVTGVPDPAPGVGSQRHELWIEREGRTILVQYVLGSGIPEDLVDRIDQALVSMRRVR